MGHGHHHGHGAHAHPQASATRTFAWVTLINLAYTAVEAGYGFHTNSLALLSDALHNLGDVLGLALAWGAAALAGRRPRGRHTYGWRRATLLSPLANAVLLVVFSGSIGYALIRTAVDMGLCGAIVAKLMVESVLFVFNFAVQKGFVFPHPAATPPDRS